MVGNGTTIALTVDVGWVDGVRVSTLGVQGELGVMLVGDAGLCEEKARGLGT